MSIMTIPNVPRKCGRKVAGGVYLSSEGGSPNGSLPRFVRINPPIPHPDKFFRGWIEVDGAMVLARASFEEWLSGPSKQRMEKAKGDQWAVTTFGMTETMRLRTGECAGIKSIEEAQAHLASKIAWNDQIVVWVRQLTLDEIPNLKGAAEPHARLVRHAQDFKLLKRLDDLMGLLAAAWQLADALPPSKKAQGVASLVRIVALMNLPKDAVAMYNRYIKGEH